ncbi:MAG: hypothetical protein KKF44_04750 [Nanoarchaeota archaeon]|nr:hypothetical protein [Nanoarchaeota archaeon]
MRNYILGVGLCLLMLFSSCGGRAEEAAPVEEIQVSVNDLDSYNYIETYHPLDDSYETEGIPRITFRNGGEGVLAYLEGYECVRFTKTQNTEFVEMARGLCLQQQEYRDCGSNSNDNCQEKYGTGHPGEIFGDEVFYDNVQKVKYLGSCSDNIEGIDFQGNSYDCVEIVLLPGSVPVEDLPPEPAPDPQLCGNSQFDDLEECEPTLPADELNECRLEDCVNCQCVIPPPITSIGGHQECVTLKNADPMNFVGCNAQRKQKDWLHEDGINEYCDNGATCCKGLSDDEQSVLNDNMWCRCCPDSFWDNPDYRYFYSKIVSEFVQVGTTCNCIYNAGDAVYLDNPDILGFYDDPDVVYCQPFATAGIQHCLANNNPNQLCAFDEVCCFAEGDPAIREAVSKKNSVCYCIDPDDPLNANAYRTVGIGKKCPPRPTSPVSSLPIMTA